MTDQTIHNVTSHDWVIIEWIGKHRTVSASAMTWLEWHEELLELRAERDALAAELARLRRRWNHVAGLAQTMGVKMDGQNAWRFQPLYHGFGPTIEAAVDDAIERAEKARGVWAT